MDYVLSPLTAKIDVARKKDDMGKKRQKGKKDVWTREVIYGSTGESAGEGHGEEEKGDVEEDDDELGVEQGQDELDHEHQQQGVEQQRQQLLHAVGDLQLLLDCW
ncbi:unnamed protein product [Urochloa humidicola]